VVGVIAAVTLPLGGYLATVGGVAIAAFVTGYEFHRVREGDAAENAAARVSKAALAC
jgi:hypothetical protein